MSSPSSSAAQVLAQKRSKFKRKALIIGINKFQLGEGASLQGCVNDAKDFKNTLLVCGFPPSNIRMLLDQRATKANVVKNMEWLVKDAKPGDVLAVYWSGHGTNKRDVTGNEPDKLTEMVVTHDFDWYDESTHFTDDDFYHYLTEKVPAGTRTEAVLDTCHSGSGTRSLFRRPNAPGMTARFLTPPEDVVDPVRPPSGREKRSWFGLSNVEEPTTRPASTTTRYRPNGELSEKFVEVTQEKEQKEAAKQTIGLQNNASHYACRDNELSWELAMPDGQIRGAYTYTWCGVLRKREGNITRGTLYNLVANQMYNEGYEQHPDIDVGSDIALKQFPFRRNFEDDATEIAIDE
jgi:hypothetical protein